MRLEKTEKCLEQVWSLWEDCFHDTKAYMDFYFRWKLRDNTLLGKYDGKKLVSMVHLNPYELSIHGIRKPSYYIVAVATDASYRKRGLMRQLLTEAMKQMYDEKIPFSYLMPVKEAIYLPFDFRIITTQKRYSIPIHSIRNKEKLVAASIGAESGKTSIIYEKLEIKDEILRNQLVAFANDLLKQTEDVFTIRDSYYYHRMLAELQTSDGGILVVKQEGHVKGYLAYVIEMGKIEVTEYICEPGYESGLLSQIEQIVLRDVNSEEEKVEPSIAPPIMARIIHLQSFLELLRAKQEVEFLIHATDELLPANHGYYHMKCNKDSCTVTKLNETEYNEINPDLSGDIATLTLAFFGQIQNEKVKNIVRNASEQFRRSFEQLFLFENTYLNEIV